MRRSSIAIALVVTSLVLGACGGDSEQSDAGSAATGGPTGETSLPGAVESSETDEARDAAGQRDREAGTGRTNRVRRLPAAERARELPLVHQVVRELIAGMNARDPSICTRLFDQRLVEPSERAQETSNCRAAIAEHPGGLELAEIESVQFRETPLGTESIVQFLARQDGKRTTRFRYHLLRSGSGYRIDQPLAARQPGA